MIEYYYIKISYTVLPKGNTGCIDKKVTETLRYPVDKVNPDTIVYNYLKVLETEWGISGTIISFNSDVERRYEP